MNLPAISTWIGIVGYSIGVAVAITWVGISVANWQATHRVCVLWLGAAAAWGALFIAALAAIASDWFPWFSGIYVALAIRLSFLFCTISLIMYTISYLRHKHSGEIC